MVLWEPLHFCDNVVGLSCCDPIADAVLREEFEALNVPASELACATIVKAILCQVSKGANLHRRPIFFFSIFLSFFLSNQRPKCLQIPSRAICLVPISGCC